MYDFWHFILHMALADVLWSEITELVVFENPVPVYQLGLSRGFFGTCFQITSPSTIEQCEEEYGHCGGMQVQVCEKLEEWQEQGARYKCMRIGKSSEGDGVCAIQIPHQVLNFVVSGNWSSLSAGGLLKKNNAKSIVSHLAGAQFKAVQEDDWSKDGDGNRASLVSMDPSMFELARAMIAGEAN